MKRDPKCIQIGVNSTRLQEERNPTPIQRDAIRHVYRKEDPTRIQRELNPSLYRENDPSLIQKEPSWALNEVTID